MFWLFLAVVLDSVFAQFFKLAQRQGHPAPVVVSTNYLTLGLGVLVYLLITRQLTLPIPVVLTGVTCGASFVLAMLTMNHALAKAPVGLVLTAFRMAMVFPVALGTWIWNESLSALQLGGLALALAALALMTSSGNRADGVVRHGRFILLASVLVTQGLALAAMRSIHYNGLGDFLLPIITLAGLTGGALGWLYLLQKGIRPTRRAIGLGCGIGAFNIVSMPVTLIALSHLPGTLYFPISACCVVVLDNFFAHVAWKEPMHWKARWGVFVAVCSLSLFIA